MTYRDSADYQEAAQAEHEAELAQARSVCPFTAVAERDEHAALRLAQAFKCSRDVFDLFTCLQMAATINERDRGICNRLDGCDFEPWHDGPSCEIDPDLFDQLRAFALDYLEALNA